jgi:hypothetical protein
MIDRSPRLTRDLKRLLTTVEDDIAVRCDDTPEVDGRLRTRYEAARAAHRTADTYLTWRKGEITQAAWHQAILRKGANCNSRPTNTFSEKSPVGPSANGLGSTTKAPRSTV